MTGDEAEQQIAAILAEFARGTEMQIEQIQAVYEKGFCDGYEKGLAEGLISRPRPAASGSAAGPWTSGSDR